MVRGLQHVRFIMLLCVACHVVAAAVVTAQCEPMVESRKFVPADGESYDHFGFSTALGQDHCVVGAPDDDDHGSQSGAVYVYDRQSGELRFKFTPDDSLERQQFGSAVALSGTIVAIGAPGPNSSYPFANVVYLYDLVTGQAIARFFPVDVDHVHGFGSSVAADGDLVIVGSPADDDYGRRSGSAYIWDVSDPSNPVELWKLNAHDAEAGDRFGYAVGISGDLAVVGAPEDAPLGSAYVFDVRTGKQLHKLVVSFPSWEPTLGHAIGIGAGVVVVGAPLANAPSDRAGAAYAFDAISGALLHRYVPDSPRADSYFGHSIAMRGSVAVIGAHSARGRLASSGAAFVFGARQGTLLHKIIPDDGTSYDDFGRSVAIDETGILVGAAMDDDSGEDSGSAYLYEDTDKWLTLVCDGRCPNDIVVHVAGASPNSPGAILLSFGQGSVRVPSGSPCVGTSLCLDRSARIVRTGSSNAEGVARFRAHLGLEYCGRVFLQAIDFSNCATSNVVLIE